MTPRLADAAVTGHRPRDTTPAVPTVTDRSPAGPSHGLLYGRVPVRVDERVPDGEVWVAVDPPQMWLLRDQGAGRQGWVQVQHPYTGHYWRDLAALHSDGTAGDDWRARLLDRLAVEVAADIIAAAAARLNGDATGRPGAP